MWAERCHVEKARTRLSILCVSPKKPMQGLFGRGEVEHHIPFWVAISGTDAVSPPPSVIPH